MTKSFSSQILRGLKYLHSKGIMHRVSTAMLSLLCSFSCGFQNIKSSHILMEASGRCKLSGFALSRSTTEEVGPDGAAESSTTMQGSIFWMAPEVVRHPGQRYDTKVDIWSAGCVVLEMWSGLRPWVDDEAVAVMFKVNRYMAFHLCTANSIRNSFINRKHPQYLKM